MRKVFLTLAVFCALSSGYLGWRIWLGRKAVVAASARVHVVPFVIEQDTKLYEGEYAGKIVEHRRLMRASDGSESIVMQNPARPETGTNRGVTSSTGEIVAAFGALGRKMSGVLSYRDTAARLEFMSHPPRDCKFSPTEVIEGEESIMGVRVVKVRQTGRVNESVVWRAPRYACADFRFQSYRVAADGTRTLTSESWTTAFSETEPTGGQFASPSAEYIESKPSEIVRAANHGNLPDAKCPTCASGMGERMDARYAAKQSR